MNYGKLIVIKVGTSSLTNESGTLDITKLQNIVNQIAKLIADSHLVILVTSAAVAAGYRHLGFNKRPSNIAGKQAAAAVGQALLMEEYNRAFSQHKIKTAQLLITKDDFKDKRRYKNVWRVFEVLLNRKVVPIINENDTVSIDELKFGDNDRLSAQVAAMVHADMLILATDINGLYTADPRLDASAQLIPKVDKITPAIEDLAKGSKNVNATGGMATKIIAAKIATNAGVFTFICNTNQEDILIKAVNHTAIGTAFSAKADMKTRKQWVAYHGLAKGKLFIDEGAKFALCDNNKSLLPIGIKAISGDFNFKDIVEVYQVDHDVLLGKGIVNYDAKQLASIIGQPTASIVKQYGNKYKAVVIHQNDWVNSLDEEK